MTTSALPTEQTPIKMAPELAEALEGLLEHLDEDELAAAQEAIREVYKSGTMGTFAELLGAYREAIEEAIGYELEDGDVGPRTVSRAAETEEATAEAATPAEASAEA